MRHPFRHPKFDAGETEKLCMRSLQTMRLVGDRTVGCILPLYFIGLALQRLMTVLWPLPIFIVPVKAFGALFPLTLKAQNPFPRLFPMAVFYCLLFTPPTPSAPQVPFPRLLPQRWTAIEDPLVAGVPRMNTAPLPEHTTLPNARRVSNEAGNTDVANVVTTSPRTPTPPKPPPATKSQPQNRSPKTGKGT